MMNPFSKLASKFHKSEEGVTALEYALIAALIAVGIIVGARAAGTGANTTFNTVGTAMTANAP
ncbi:MAG TPA: Flp family type IVb pilin [Polyangiales bacterium]|nr:Flp family type IVb pilin [Polyangiales bacterium]